MRRCLVVANHTLASEELLEVLRARAAPGDTEIHLVLPASYSDHYTAVMNALTSEADTGMFPVRTSDCRRIDLDRLTTALDRLHAAGIPATGEVGETNPIVAVRQVLAHQPADEIVVSTLPPGVSRWLRMDLPRRLARHFDLPVTHVATRLPATV